jgi:hypothetical protein
MAALVAAIHVFGVVSKVVDGLAEPSHDLAKAPVVNMIFNRTAVPRDAYGPEPTAGVQPRSPGLPGSKDCPAVVARGG